MLKDIVAIRVFEMEDGAELAWTKLLLEEDDPRAILQLAACLRIVEDINTFVHCMCIGDEMIAFYSENGQCVANITWHHGKSIRWDAWKTDADLQDGYQLLTWLAGREVSAPLKRFQFQQRQQEDARKSRERWCMALPECFQRFENEISRSPAWVTANFSQLYKIYSGVYPCYEDAVLVLLTWYGSGEGRWSGCPGYEEITYKFLLSMPLNQIINTIATHSLSMVQLEGTARFFCHWDKENRPAKEAAARVLPAGLRSQLLHHCLSTNDEYKQRAGKQLFGNTLNI
jgi:hypothetical protein